MNNEEMMMVSGGFKYIPYYENNKFVRLIQVSSICPTQEVRYYSPWLPEYGEPKKLSDLIW